jgi:chromosome segregation ATPase
MPDPPQWITIAQAVELTGKSGRTIRRWMKTGKVNFKRDQRRVFIDRTSLDRTRPDVDRTGDRTVDRTLPDAEKEIVRLTGEIEKLEAINTRMDAEMERLQQDLSDWKSQAAALIALAVDQKKLIEAGTGRRRWRWPWQRGE